MNHQFEFDEWTKDLARGVSRREALRRLGGGLAAMLLSAVGLNTAWGAPPSRPPKCSDYCNTLPTPQRANCNNACKQCGGNTQNICPSRDSDKVACCSQGTGCCSGSCTTLGTNQNCAACGDTCAGGQSCVNGACQCPSGSAFCPNGGSTCCPTTQACCNGVCCNAGEACVGGSCVAKATCSGDACNGSGGPCSATNPGCRCFATTEGASLCLDGTGQTCTTSTPCTSSADCPPGSFCAGVACCVTHGVCLPAGSCLT